MQSSSVEVPGVNSCGATPWSTQTPLSLVTSSALAAGTSWRSRVLVPFELLSLGTAEVCR